MHTPPYLKIKKFQKKILSFYKEQGRTLPWRQTTNPYHIMVSEIMLQQTQVDRVIPYYTTWIKKWPTIQALAQAKRAEVLKAWLGLGYNNRAIRLHQAAQVMTQNHQGNIIQAITKKKIPGIGPYTTNAIQIFSQNKNIATIDTNIRRILIHEFNLPSSTPDKDIEHLAQQCVPQGKSRDWHNALMDYGSTILTSKKTGIKPKTTQSTFKGSDRQIRAQLLRIFLNTPKKQLSTTDLKQKISTQHLKKILTTMIKDTLIIQKGRKYQLKT